MNTPDTRGLTALWAAAEFNRLAVAEALLDAGADPAPAMRDRARTPLHRAAHEGYAGMVALLAGRGAAVDPRTAEGYTPLMVAAAWEPRGRVAALEALLAAGADVDAADHAGWTALIHAACKRRGPAVSALLKAGAKVTAPSKHGQTALHGAAGNGHAAVASILLEAGADVDAKALDGTRPLHMACHGGHREVVRTLLAAGSDPRAPTAAGKSPADLARDGGHAEVVELLEEAVKRTK